MAFAVRPLVNGDSYVLLWNTSLLFLVMSEGPTSEGSRDSKSRLFFIILSGTFVPSGDQCAGLQQPRRSARVPGSRLVPVPPTEKGEVAWSRVQAVTSPGGQVTQTPVDCFRSRQAACHGTALTIV